MIYHIMAQSTLHCSSSFTYDVFLNFRGVDTRNNFTGNLYNSLCQKGIQTFIDDEGLNKGEEITPSLLQAIEESRIFISIFSENYASSTYCLDELVKILACSKAQGHSFMPIFYDVNPSEVRHQTGSYADAMAEHEERFQDQKDKVQKWREALSQAANISGWHFALGSQQPEYKFIANIIEKVSKIINPTPLYVAENLVGVDTPLLEVTSLLELGSDDRVNMVGIYGIGGVGKSTIARAVYNKIADQFEGVCFLGDLRKKAINHDLAQLQEILLSDILEEEDIKVRDVNRGISMIKRRLHRKKVLLILDDVDKLRQLQVLVGGLDWFGLGSKIIITTRDKHLLNTHGIVKSYEVKQLNDEKALELFSWHAFKRNKIDPSYADMSKRAISYFHGLPLALEVIGSHLFGKSLAIWKSALDKYERILHKDICEVLEVSYKDLEEDEKEIFLDIACFFNSCKISYVKEILHIRGFHVENGIQVLIDKSLMKIDCNHCIVMHDLIQDMGREIVRRESTSEPGKRSRLWFYEDVVHVLEENTGTDTIEVIVVDLYKVKEVHWNGMGFKMMKSLRILIMGNVHFSKEPQNLPFENARMEWIYVSFFTI
ncbi:TMV resistance protein N-like isoform X2 [Abrus precatorius]|uniref:TMV resistance protein N-like isoform X2 n=1 Tax=Abrus precatorius TaxID=3816 RepID=A0A8B8KM85_ABRPR|nr:TMV resistance protein N-like isoform X2 [Abrus precatorius]